MAWRYSQRSRRTDTTGLRTQLRGKYRRNKRNIFTPVRIGLLRYSQTRGFSIKPNRLVTTQSIFVNILSPVPLTREMTVIRVVSNPNSVFRENGYITRGAVLLARDGDQELQVRVTSRPGQVNMLFGVLVN